MNTLWTVPWTVLFLAAAVPLILGIPALLLVAGRQRLPPKSRSVGAALLTAWGVLVLSVGDTIVHSLPLARDWRMFWFGFFLAAGLFLMGFMLACLRAFVRQARGRGGATDDQGTA